MTHSRTLRTDYAFVNAMREVLGMGPLPYTTDTRGTVHRREFSSDMRIYVSLRESWERTPVGSSRSQWWQA